MAGNRIPWRGWLVVWSAWLVLFLSLVLAKALLEDWFDWGMW